MNRKKYNGIFVTDLDGTLLKDDKTMSERDLSTLSRLQGSGIITVIATGRSDYSFFTLINNLGVHGQKLLKCIDYIVFSTGAGILSGTDQRLLHSHCLLEMEVLGLCAYLEPLAVDYMIHRPIPETVSFSYRSTGGDNSDFWRRIALYKEYSTPLAFVGDMAVWSGEATEVLCILPESGDAALAAKISGDLKDFSVIHATSPLDHSSIWIEIFPSSVSKSRAVEFIAKQAGVSRGGVCAVGNDYNDFDLLEWAGAGYLVANGPAALQGRFENVSSNNHSGVTAAAEHWMMKCSDLPWFEIR